MMTKNKYLSVADMLDNLTNEPHLRDELDAFVSDREIVKYLSAMRCARGLTQEDIARALNCTQSCVSKLESGVDADLKVGDIDRYLATLGLDSTLILRAKNATTLDAIKYHVFAIRSTLDDIVELSQPDDGSAESAAITHLKTIVNMAKLVVESASNIPLEGIRGKAFCKIELSFAPEECDTLR